MSNPQRLRLAQSILLILAGLMAGQLLAASDPTVDHEVEARKTPEASMRDRRVLPELEVLGADIKGLPRYPKATRVEYRQVIENDLVVTEVEYLVADELEAVHDFYRNVFYTEEWTVADLEFYREEWTFFVMMGSREALVEIEKLGQLVEVEIEISEPQSDLIPIVAPTSPLVDEDD